MLLTDIVALSIYDAILSISLEVRCIWKRKFGVGMILYLSIRYGTILYILFQIHEIILSTRTLAVSAVRIQTIAI